ncbi:hypothetical protein HYW76_00055 [Candidatus Pacearchaeota archaeon]|nr:hypothetical protein [Candidatus Pacearchaeota archaeon]
MSDKLNPFFEISRVKLEADLGVELNKNMKGYDIVSSPRSLVKVDEIALFRRDVFYALIKRIPLRSKSEDKIYPYEDAEIDVFAREPRGFYLGQRFILKEKLISIMTGLEKGIFEEFTTQGISKMPPVQIYGADKEGRKIMAIYVPPIAEIHDNKVVLLDGIHRSTICRGAGTSVNAVHITGVSVRLPFEPITWDDAKTMDEKPAISERYFNLKQVYFRDLASVGIDG